jgi:hypothetical protein
MIEAPADSVSGEGWLSASKMAPCYYVFWNAFLQVIVGIEGGAGERHVLSSSSWPFSKVTYICEGGSLTSFYCFFRVPLILEGPQTFNLSQKLPQNGLQA